MTHIYIHGKFSTSTRRGKVTVDGNIVYCSIDNFRNYANYTRFFAYKHDENIQVNNAQTVTTSSYTRYIKANGGLNVRNKANGSKIGALANGTKVTVYEVDGNWSRIDQGWVSSLYLSTTKSTSTTSSKSSTSSKVTYKYLRTKTTLYSKSNLTGTKYQYLSGTKVKILKHINSNVDYVQVVKTNRKAYVKRNAYK